MYAATTRPTPAPISISTSRNTRSFDAYTRYKSLTVGHVKTQSQTKRTSVKLGIPAGTDLTNAGKNGNRTAQTVNGVSTTYCYNNADQLISTTDTQVGVPVYDDHGNTTQLAGGGAPITFTYDALDANTKIQQGNNRVEYVKSASGSVLSKKEYRNNVLDKIYRYAAGVLITCDVANQTNCNVVDKYVSLPGGVALTIKASGNVYSIKNFHGDTALTVSAAGVPTSSVFLYDPFGQTAPSSTFGTGGYGGSSKNPSNSTNQSMSWAASPSRKAEASDLFNLSST
jgi:hypothetical protein